MARSKRNTKKMMKGGVFPFTWTTSEKPNENSLENSTSVIPSDQGDKKQEDKEELNKVEGDKAVKELTFSERIFGKSEIDPATGKPKKPFWQLWGGKTKRRSKGKKTRKARK
jgi:hypothetical protein